MREEEEEVEVEDQNDFKRKNQNVKVDEVAHQMRSKTNLAGKILHRPPILLLQ